MSSKGALILGGVFVVAFLLLGLGQCGYDRIKTLQTLENAEADVVSEYPAVDVIRPAEVRLHQSGGQAVLLVDARTLEEFEVSHLEGSVHLTDKEELLAYLKERQEPVDLLVIYGALGYRSAKLADSLAGSDVPDVASLRGGIFRWVNDGGTVVDQNGAPTSWVHPCNKHWGRLLKKEHRFDPSSAQ